MNGLSTSDLFSLGLTTPQVLTGGVQGGPNSNTILAALNQTYGAIKYTQQSVSRYPYYSYQAYPLAGGSSFAFFGANMATVGTECCNLEQAGNIGNYSYIINSIGFDIFLYIPTVANNAPWSYDPTTGDASAPYADIVHGLTQGGVGELSINNTVWDHVNLPFMYSPSCIGKSRMELSQAGLNITQAGGSPFAVTGAGVSLCAADVARRFYRRRILDNPIFLAPQTTFTMSLAYPFGAIPIISTGVITAGSTTPPVAASLMIGVRWDGWRYSPVS
jgi:hypothetical protein